MARSAQLDLDLRPPSLWGGYRRGAGRKPGPVRRDPHRRRAPLASRHPCHVTLRVRRNVPSLRIARVVRELAASFRRACERGRFRLVEYSIQTNHVHMIVEAESTLDPRFGDEIHRLAALESGEPDLRAERGRPRGPVSPSRAPNPPGGPERHRLRPAQREATPRAGRTGACGQAAA